MKLKRSKEARKALTFYRTSFGLIPPYRVLVDGPMAAVSLHRSIYLKESLASLLETPAPLLVTSACVRREVVALAATAAGNQAATPDGSHDRGGGGGAAPDLSAAALFLKRIQTVKCAHAGGGSVPASECILSLVGGGDVARAGGRVSTPAGGDAGAPPPPPPCLLVATNDGELIRALRARPGVPVIRIVNQTALRVETPSAASAADAAAREGAKDALSPAERAALTAIVGDGGAGGGGGTAAAAAATGSPTRCRSRSGNGWSVGVVGASRRGGGQEEAPPREPQGQTRRAVVSGRPRGRPTPRSFTLGGPGRAHRHRDAQRRRRGGDRR
ncbi:hypothetical protein BU14_0191s0011 [Porphyra umbilicalis]|uniref:PIN domain-containing protein n=1 Tax=Porphyra umbilicalis TaxID=2786 RepID=A0A1X6P6A3_PORUM|nr:hypothetical protein BU14_0191s0011 [Porphyra umbilicalis]|eukprot:OSX76431.1 hypothetical protein BU14_0191s0011 [Porphyra umbilicalis]